MMRGAHSQLIAVPTLGVLVIGLFGYLDYATGPDFSFSLSDMADAMRRAGQAMYRNKRSPSPAAT